MIDKYCVNCLRQTIHDITGTNDRPQTRCMICKVIRPLKNKTDQTITE